METLRQDIQYGLRMLLRNKTATIFCVAALALGIGANTAIFSVFNAVLLRPLPYKQPDRLVMLYGGMTQNGFERRSASYPEFADWRERNHVFEQIAAIDGPSFNLTGSDNSAGPERIQGELVSANYFDLLGVQPALGRAFKPEEDRTPDTHPVAIIGHGLWARRFALDQGIVGRQIRINDRSYSVVGVMPEGFRGAANDDSELWLPMAMVSSVRSAQMLIQRRQRWLAAIARLQPGVTVEQAQAEMSSVAAALTKEFPAEHTNRGVEVIAVHEDLFGSYRLSLLVLLGAVGSVLLIACVNVANMLLARVSARQKEVAVRSALGATRSRVIRLLLVENCMLSLISGGVGVLLGLWSTDLLLSQNLISFPAYVNVSIDARVLAFSLMVSLLTGLIFGSAPALQTAKADLNSTLKEGARGSSAGRRHRLLAALVVTEVTLSVVLLVGAVLMLRTVRSIQAVDSGFEPRNILRMQFSLPSTRYDRTQASRFVQQLVDRVSTLPSVQRTAFATDAPWGDTSSGGPIEPEGQTTVPGQEYVFFRHYVTTEFFSTLGIPLIQGRLFSTADTPETPPVVIVSETLAREFWPGQDPIGKRVREGGGGSGRWLNVVGVVRDVKYRGFPRNPDSHPDVYFPVAQFGDREGVLLVKTGNEPLDLAAAVRHEFNALDPDLPVYNTTTMEALGSNQASQSRFTTLLLSIFGGLALFLAVVGVYGVMSYSVSERTHEIGIRMTLGAQRRDVLQMLIARGLSLVCIGLAAGLGLSLVLTRTISNLLYGVSPTDPFTFAIVALVLGAVSLAASYIPARRATRVDPMTAVRSR